MSDVTLTRFELELVRALQQLRAADTYATIEKIHAALGTKSGRSLAHAHDGMIRLGNRGLVFRSMAGFWFPTDADALAALVEASADAAAAADSNLFSHGGRRVVKKGAARDGAR